MIIIDTKEAIEKIKQKYEGWQGYAKTQEKADELGRERDKVIALLKRGEAFENMWNNFKWDFL